MFRSLLFKSVLVFLTLLLVITPATATIPDSSYTYDGSYYWYNNVAYTRTKVWNYVNGYYNYGCWVPGYWTYIWEYTHATLPVTYKTPDWRTKLLEIVGNRDKAENKLRVAAQEQDLFNETVALLGLTGNFRIQDYGRTSVRYSHQNYQLNTAGNNANTVYGYNFTSLKDIWGDTSPAANYQSAAMLTKNAQDLAGDANKGFQALVGLDANGRARAAEILVRGIAAAQALEATKGPAQSHEVTTGTVTTTVPNNGQTQGTPVNQVPTTGQTGQNKPLTAIPFSQTKGGARCAACHTGSAPSGGFNINSFASMDADGKTKVVARMFTKNDKLVMPPLKDKAGNVIPRLTLEERADFLAQLAK